MATRKRGTGPSMIARSRAVSPAEKAAFHQEEGAGRSRTLRQFFGLTTSDETAIVDLVERDIERRLRGKH